MKFGFYSPYLDTFGGGERYMLTLASHLSKGHIVDIFWDDPAIKAPLARFLKIDLANTRFVKNIFKASFFKKTYSTFGYNFIFILSDGSVPLTLASRNVLHFQVPFNFPPVSLRTKVKLTRYGWIVANSNFTKSYIDKSFGVDSKVIYPPVDVNRIKLGKKEKIILSVGRFSKGQLHPKKQDYKYVHSLKKAARGYGIRIFENLPVDKLRNLYSQTSIYWHATGFGEDEIKFPQKMEHFGI